MNCNDISLAGCRNNAIVHDDTLIGSGTVSSPLGVNPEAININDVSTTCPDNSMFYADAGDILCTGTALTHDGSTLGGDGNVNLSTPDTDLKLDVVNKEFDARINDDIANKEIQIKDDVILLSAVRDNTHTFPLLPRVVIENKNSSDSNTIELSSVNLGKWLIRDVGTNGIKSGIQIAAATNASITTYSNDSRDYYAPPGGWTSGLIGKDRNRNKTTITANGNTHIVATYTLPTTRTTIRATGVILMNAQTGGTTLSYNINRHLAFVAANNYTNIALGGELSYTDIAGAIIDTNYNTITNQFEITIFAPNTGIIYDIYTDIELFILNQ